MFGKKYPKFWSEKDENRSRLQFSKSINADYSIPARIDRVTTDSQGGEMAKNSLNILLQKKLLFFFKFVHFAL